MGPLLPKFIGEQDSGKILRQEYHMLPWQPHFRRHVSSGRIDGHIRDYLTDMHTLTRG